MTPPDDLRNPRNQLEADGWREFLDRCSEADVSMLKFYDTANKCVLNPDKPGIQFIIRLWDWSRFERNTGRPLSLEVQVCGSTDRCAYTIKSHSHDNVADTLAEIPRLLTAWEAINDAQ